MRAGSEDVVVPGESTDYCAAELASYGTCKSQFAHLAPNVPTSS